jgi:acetyl-CoA synthetase
MKGAAMVAFCVLSDWTAGVPPATPGKAGVRDANNQPSGTSTETIAAGTAALQSELKTLVAKDMGKPLAPSKIHFVSALPKTRNAKVMRRVLRSAYLGEDPGDLSALENPDAVTEISKLRT